MNDVTRIILLNSADGFMAAFWELAQTTRTRIEAYEKLEEEYYSYFGKNRYASYNSFVTCRDSRNKKKSNVNS